MTMSTKKDGDRGFPSDSKAPPASAGSGSESKKRDDAGGETVEEQEAKLAPPDGGDKKAPVQNSAQTAEAPVLKSPGAEGTGATGKVGDSPAFAGEPSIAPSTFTASVDAGQDGAPVRDDVFEYVKDPGFAGERSLDAFDKDAAAPVLKSSAPAGETPPGGETKGGGGPIGGAEGKGDSGSKGFPSEPQPGGGAAAGTEAKGDSGSKGFPSEPQPGGGANAGAEAKGDSGDVYKRQVFA